MLSVLHEMTCLARFKKLHAWPVHKTGCLKLHIFFLDVFDHGAILDLRLSMQSGIFNGRHKTAKSIITIFVFVLNLKFPA